MIIDFSLQYKDLKGTWPPWCFPRIGRLALRSAQRDWLQQPFGSVSLNTGEEKKKSLSQTSFPSWIISGTSTTNGKCLVTFQKWMSCRSYHASSADGSPQHFPVSLVSCQDIAVRIALYLREVTVPNVAATHCTAHCNFTGKCFGFFLRTESFFFSNGF